MPRFSIRVKKHQAVKPRQDEDLFFTCFFKYRYLSNPQIAIVERKLFSDVQSNFQPTEFRQLIARKTTFHRRLKLFLTSLVRCVIHWPFPELSAAAKLIESL